MPLNYNYAGPVDVEDDAFILRFDRLIFANGERVSFELSGEDHGGPFAMDGVAQRAAGDFYVAGALQVKSTRGGRATIRFFELRPIDEALLVRGEWEQDSYEGSPWAFVGELDPSPSR